jgi:hypothetical protein
MVAFCGVPERWRLPSDRARLYLFLVPGRGLWLEKEPSGAGMEKAGRAGKEKMI